MELNKIKIDLEKQIAGVWVDVDADTSLLVARMHNPEFTKVFERAAIPYKQAARKGIVSDSKALEGFNQALAKTVLLGWKGLKLDGEEVSYSHETCYEILSDESLTNFKDLVVEIATNEENFRAEEVEEAGKKSKNTSIGKESGDPS